MVNSTDWVGPKEIGEWVEAAGMAQRKTGLPARIEIETETFREGLRYRLKLVTEGQRGADLCKSGGLSKAVLESVVEIRSRK